MAVFPVIMCGGSGIRLWPTSRPDRPKPFAALTGDLSGFQDAVLRVTGLEDAAATLVVGGATHARLIAAQLAAAGVEADVLLEPAPRDSAAAMAAAAAWVLERDPDGVMAVVSADHHVPDAKAFRAALNAAVRHAQQGWIVTLGVRPTSPATAYGYIRPAPGEGVRPVAAFVEKPDLERARAHVAAGDLWNSGNFVTPARLLADELEQFAPSLLAAARAALAEAATDELGTVLGGAFLSAPRISIDYAVMEKTGRAAVLPVDFAWSDVGAWDAVLAASSHDSDGNRVIGDAVVSGVSGSYVRAAGAARVTVIGLKDVAVVAEGDEVLVMDLARSQALKPVVEGLPAPRRFASLPEASAWMDRWLRTAALPIWWALGADHQQGGYYEGLSLEGVPHAAPRRGRVQGRQVYVFAQAGAMGWRGPWRRAAWHGLDYMLSHFQRPDGLIRSLVSLDGAALDDNAAVYDQAFALLGMASLHGVDPDRKDLVAEAARMRQGLEALRHPAGLFRESGDHPFQANAHMHMFEAALAWMEAGQTDWGDLADEIAQAAMRRFIDDRGVLREFFDADWIPKSGDDGRLVEPGHQFEWAWLLDHWGRLRQRPEGRLAAKGLYAAGRRGVDPKRACAVNALWDDFSIRDAHARLWPQTEHLKAALTLGTPEEALEAINCLKLYLETPAVGLWRDKLRPDGTFVEEPAPATSFYHILCACRTLFDAYPVGIKNG